MSQTAPAPTAVGSPLLSQSPVDIRPQDTDPSALPPLRFHHSTGRDPAARSEVEDVTHATSLIRR